MATDKKVRVLVVDDEQDITTIIKKGLENMGCLVDSFNDPEQALLHFKQNYYDIMIFDIRMPKMTGFQLYREIRKKENNNSSGKTKACFMTAFDVYKEEFEKMFPSYDDVKCFIKKPIKVKDLHAIIISQVEKK